MDKIDLENLAIFAQNAEGVSKSNDELLVVYDEDEVPQGTASRYLCHKLGLLHKVVYLFIENEREELLLQTRGDTKKGRLDVPVGGHLTMTDKNDVEALIRESKEEIGLDLKPEMLQLIFSYKRRNYGTLVKPHEKNFEIRKVFYTKLSSETNASIFNDFKKREEIEMVRNVDWHSKNEILSAIEDNRCADGLKESFAHFLNWKITTLPNSVYD